MSEVPCCPECDSTNYHVRSRKSGYKCTSCMSEFDEPKRRMRKHGDHRHSPHVDSLLEAAESGEEP